MQGPDVLPIIAEVGAALAGFSGIVVALRPRFTSDVREVLRDHRTDTDPFALMKSHPNA